jgi:hypothetical protein
MPPDIDAPLLNPCSSPLQTPDGYVVAWPVTPTTPMPLIDTTTDTGKWITAILSKPSETSGKRFPAAAGWITPEEIAATSSEITGIEVWFRQIPDEVLKSFLPPSQADMRLAGLVVCRDCGYLGPDARAEVAESLKVCWKEY